MTLLAAPARRRSSPAAGKAVDSTDHAVIHWAEAQTLTTYEALPDYATAYIQIREQDDIVYDPAEPDPSRRWKFYYSARRVGGASNGDSHIFAVFSADRATWSSPVQCTRAGSPLIGEDPTITQTLAGHTAHRDAGSSLVMFLEVGSDVDAFTSTDGIAWTLAQENAIARSSAGLDASLVGSPCARHDGTQYLVAYEGISSTAVESSGLAYGAALSSLGKVGAPFLTSAGLGFASSSAFIDSMWVTEDGTRIHVTGHSGSDGPITMFRAYTTNLDPITWEPADFTLIGMVDAIRNDLTCDWWGDRLITAPADDLSLVAVSLVAP